MEHDYKVIVETKDREAKRTYWNAAIGLQQLLVFDAFRKQEAARLNGYEI